MENASKALIIAGAILLAILLISLGIMIFNQAQGTIKGAGMSEAQISAFNQKFTKYQGKQKGSTIRSLVQDVMSNNNSEEASDETRIAINGTNNIGGGLVTPSHNGWEILTLQSDAGASPEYKNTFKNTETYTVEFKYSNGRITVIEVY